MEHYKPNPQSSERIKMMATKTTKFNPDIYQTIASNHLVVYSIYTLHNDRGEISSEDIISACFTLFPKKFSLKKYPQWPDSALVGRRLKGIRVNGLIAAKTDPGFKLTARGARLAEKVARTLGVAIPGNTKPSRAKKASGSPGKNAGTTATKTISSVPKPAPKNIKQKQKAEIGQAMIPPAPVEKAYPVKKEITAQTKSTGKVLPVPGIEIQKVKQKPRAEVEKSILPITKVSPTKQKRISPAKKILPASKIKREKVNQGQKAEDEKKVTLPGPVAKTHRAKQKQTAPAKNVLRPPVIDTPKVSQGKKSDTKRNAVHYASVPKTHVAKQKQTAPVIPAIPGVEPLKVKQEKKADAELKVISKVPEEKTHQARTGRLKKVPPSPILQAPKIRQEKKSEAEQKDVSTAPVVIVEPAKQKRIGSAKKVLPVPVIETPKIRQKRRVKAAPSVAVVERYPIKEKQTASSKKALPVPVVKIPIAKQEKEAQPAMPAAVIPQEAKVRAGKFVRMMETSDAYVNYKKNGTSSSINEFDFRSLLLCTMESSPETLARNVELFKGYAELHNRKDLIVFLFFCKDKFSHIFAPQKKAIRKTK